MNDAQDPFEYDDAAYVLGAMSLDERAAFEQHLTGCVACAGRVRELRDIPTMLAGVTAADLIAVNEPVPDTLWPALLRRAKAHRSRGRWIAAALAAVAAACLVALAVVLWPSQPSSRHETAARPFVAVARSPVSATARLTAKAWGTAIDVDCHYADGTIEKAFRYDLVVYGRDGTRQDVGSWRLPPGRDITFPAGTALSENQIAKVEISLPNGTAILRLTI